MCTSPRPACPTSVRSVHTDRQQGARFSAEGVGVRVSPGVESVALRLREKLSLYQRRHLRKEEELGPGLWALGFWRGLGLRVQDLGFGV